MLGIVTLVFLMLRMLPGDPAVFIGESASPEALASLRRNPGARPAAAGPIRTYLAKIVQGNFGQSLLNGTPVLGIVGAALPITMVVGGWPSS